MEREVTTPDPATLREALSIDQGISINQRGEVIEYPNDYMVVVAAARWALDLIEGGEHCDDCGRLYPDVYSLPDGLWARIHERAPAGLLCPTCALARLAALIEEGKEVWWCETHKQGLAHRHRPPACPFGFEEGPNESTHEYRCVVVKRLLVAL